MKIVRLEPSQHKTGRWLVWLEDGSLLRVGEGDVVSLSLYTGKELGEQEAAALTAAAEHSKLNERAVTLLSARAMSGKELMDKLSTPSRRKKGEEEADAELLSAQREQRKAAAEQVVRRMEELGLINDEEYGRSVVRHYSAKGFGERKIRDELYRRGVPRELWDSVLSELSEREESGADKLDELVKKKLRGAELTRENLKKASDYLARRGFGWEEISSALERYTSRIESEIL